MPGIVGIISRKSVADCERLIQAMTSVMESETFYRSGRYSVPGMGLHTGWVAREKSFGADQIYLNEQRDVALVLSGECFLDAEMGVDLRRNGHDIGTNKASWLVHHYEEQGDRFFRDLNGVFSGLLIDKRQAKAVLFNDRYGMERIYCHETADAFYFASEAKALLRILPELRRFDKQGVAQFLTFGCTLEERTLFNGISRLPAGAKWSFENGAVARHKYFSSEIWEAQSALSAEAFESEFQSTFRRILPRYSDSEISPGISLTAGLDTRMIMACLPETAMDAVCYTYSGQNKDTLDAKLAARVSAACGLHHKILRLDKDFFNRFSTWVDKTIYATDGNFGIIGAHEIYLSRQARDLSPIRLAGVFGGEIFRSVSTFKPIKLSRELVQQCAIEGGHHGNEHPVTFAAFKEIPWNMFGTVTACRSQLCLRSPYLDNDIVALAYRAPVILRKSCDSAVRFVRNNNKAVARIPTDMGYLGPASGPASVFNRMLSKITFKLDYYYSHGLPPKLSLLEPAFRPFAAGMQHFGSHRYLHYHNWFRTELAPYVKESLTDAQTIECPFWNKGFVKRMADEHIFGRKNYVNEINAVLTLASVERLLFKEFSPQNDTPGGCLIKSSDANLVG